MRRGAPTGIGSDAPPRPAVQGDLSSADRRPGADTAEIATFTKSQILLQSATAMLAQANNIPALALKLLG